MMGFKYMYFQSFIILLWMIQYWSFDNSLLWYLYIVPTSAVGLLTVLTYDHDYWSSRGVFSPPAWPLVGHIKTIVTFEEQGGIFFKRIYDLYKHLRIVGTHQFFTRTLVVCDPELIRRMCVNDFSHFVDRGFYFDNKVDPLAGSILYLRGNEWRKLRAKITPIFSPNKLRGMFPLIDDTAKEFVLKIKNLLNKNSQSDVLTESDIENNNDKQEPDEHKQMKCDNNDRYTTPNNDINTIVKETKSQVNKDNNNSIKETENLLKFNSNDRVSNMKNDINGEIVNSEKLCGGYTADAIVPCAFGVKSNVMDNEKDHFAVALQAYYEKSPFNIFEKTMRQFWPSFVLFFKMRTIPKQTHHFFYDIVTRVLRERERGFQEKRGDFIDMMMALRHEGKHHRVLEDDVEITDMVIAANAFIIFLGGFETTSSTLAFLLLELAAHPAVQEKMREEITEVKSRHGGTISYDELNELVYMEMVIQETLRLYPPFPTIQRICTKDYQVPGTNVVVQRDSLVLFPILALQRDEEYFKDSNSFIPERWADGTSSPPPGVYMPFGDGPRYCIGKRFAMLQMKSCLARLLCVVRVSPAPGRVRTAPFAPDPRSPLTLHPEDATLTISLLN